MQNLPDSLSRAEKLELVALLEEKGKRRRENKLRDYLAYAKQAEFHANGMPTNITGRWPPTKP